MIINIRGTSGSGKTTLARRVMDMYKIASVQYVEGRKRPIGYVYAAGELPPLYVVGSYESTCGGCDTITEKQFDTVYELVRQAHLDGMDVLFEGLLITAELRRAIELHKDGLPFEVISLTTPVEECISSVNARRQARRGPDAPPVKEVNTRSKHRQNLSGVKKLREAGVPVHELDRAAAVQKLFELFQVI